MSPVGEAPLTVAPVPSVGQAGARAHGTPLEITKQLVMEVIPLPTMGWTELPAMLVASTVTGVALMVKALQT